MVQHDSNAGKAKKSNLFLRLLALLVTAALVLGALVLVVYRDRFNLDALVRWLAYRDLDQALLLGVETTIQEMEERGLPIHKRTLMARDWLLAAGVTIED